FGANARDERMRDLMRLAGCERVDPKIAGGSRTVMHVEQARAVVRERGVAARRLVHALGDRQRQRLASRDVVEKNIFVAVDVSAEGDVLTIWRELAAANFPFIFREPGDLFCLSVERPDVVVAVRCVRSEEDMLAIGRKIVREVELFAVMRR